MDLSGPTWNAVEWVNAALAGGPDDVSLDEKGSSLVLQLQLRQLDLSGQLEEASFDAAGAIPKILRELERIRSESDELRRELQGIEMSLGGIQASTDRSVALLMELDRVKRNMEACASGLRETERFLSLSKSIEAALAEGKASGVVVEQIRQVRSSLHILQDVPEFRNATARLAQYEKRLELHLRPKFVAAVRANDVPSAVELSAVYRDIQQEAVMKTAYFETRREELQKFFDSQSEEPIGNWLALFYSRLLAVVTSESEWCQLLFGSEGKRQVQAELTAHLLLHFAPALAQRMQGLSLVDAVELHRHAANVLVHVDPKAHSALEQPFEQYVAGYGLLEKDFLLGELTRTGRDGIFQLAEAAVDRCESLTGLSQQEGLVSALEALFAAGRGSSNPTPSSTAAAAASVSRATVPLQQQQQEWAGLNAALKELRSAKLAHRKLRTFDSRLRARLLAKRGNERLSNDPSLAVLPEADSLAKKDIEAARTMVFDAIFGVVRRSLNDFSKLPIWTRVDVDVDRDMPKLRPDASPQVTQVIEHLFALPHHLEHLEDEEDGAEHWVSVVAKSAVDLFAAQIQAIPKMSPAGKVQLQCDVDAMSNLLSALGVSSAKLEALKGKK